MPSSTPSSPLQVPNVKRFIAFRILFNARFYYPIFTILFLDFGLSLEQFAILNTVWAISIVALEVPSGALADTIGRKNLVVAASLIMVVEMALIAFAPLGNIPLVFLLFLANRILSGAAEAAASGADEALAYDSLKELGMEERWGEVLDRQMRLQSLAFVFAMSIGAILYDHERLTAIFNFLGLGISVSENIAMRLPLFGTLLLSLGAVAITLGLTDKQHEASPSVSSAKAILASFAKTLNAGAWILKTPQALAIIAAGMLFDHIVRMVLTLSSEFYRQIEIPEYTFGFMGAGLAILGTFIPRIGRYLADHRGKAFNFIAVSLSILVGLFAMSRFVPYWSALPMALVYSGIFLNGYFVSHYLNKITDSSHRATVLSFKGLSFNLAYGAIGYIYATAIAQLRKSPDFANLEPTSQQDLLFRTVFSWAPAYFLVLAFAVFVFGILLLRNRRSDTKS